MELNTWSSLIANDIKTAKNLMSFMVGYPYFSTKENKPQAVIALYESFPLDIKMQEKEFAPLFLKLFLAHKINPDTEKYYLQFLPYWSKPDQSSVQLFNPEKSWNKKTEYKNTLEFTKVLVTKIDTDKRWNYRHEEKSNHALEFVQENQDYINSLSSKKLEKLVENFSKYNVWNNLFYRNYEQVKEMCKILKLEPIETMKNIFNSSNSQNSISQIFKNLKNSTALDLENFLQDIHAYGADKFYEGDVFLSHSNRIPSGHQHVAAIAVQYMMNKKPELVNVLIKYYEPYILMGLKTDMIPIKGTPPVSENLYEKDIWQSYLKDEYKWKYILQENEVLTSLRFLDENIYMMGKLKLHDDLNHNLQINNANDSNTSVKKLKI